MVRLLEFELLITITNLIHNKKKGLDEEHPNEGK
jgi:hypothetical protein